MLYAWSNSKCTIELRRCYGNTYSEKKTMKCWRGDKGNESRESKKGNGENNNSCYDSENRNIDDISRFLHNKGKDDSWKSSSRSIDIIFIGGKNSRKKSCPDCGDESEKWSIRTRRSKACNRERYGKRYIYECHRKSGFPVITNILLQNIKVHIMKWDVKK